MSLITKALNKVQESRQPPQEQRIMGVFQETDPNRDNIRMLVMTVIIVGAILAVFVSVVVIALDIRGTNSNQNDIYSLEKSLSLSQSQIRNLDFRLKTEIEDRNNQVSNLSSIDNVSYINIMKSIISNEHQIDYLNKYTKKLNQRIEYISDINSQAQNVASPVNGN